MVESSKENKYGLSRNIPNPVKREIRQRCGFGCVICGSAIYQYEHVDPTFEEAQEHDPDKMALLCGTHHDYVTKEIWSKGRIKDALKSPKCLEDGFSFGAFDIGSNSPTVILGTITWKETPVIIEAMGEPLLRVEAPEEAGGPFRLSGRFYDSQEQEIFTMEQNEWFGPVANWDIEIVGQRITIRRAPGEFALQIRTDPPNKLIIERIDMFFKGLRIKAQDNGLLEIISPIGPKSYSFAPSHTKSIIQSLDNLSDNVKNAWIARYETGKLTGIIWEKCDAGIALQENGEVVIGKGGNILSNGGSVLLTF